MARSVEKWKRDLVDLGGNNRLLYYRDLKLGTLDLSEDADPAPAPSAVESLLAGRSTRLSRLFPDEDDLAVVAKKVRSILAKSVGMLEERGLDTLFVASHTVSWRETISSATPAAPLLLRPLEIRPRGAGKTDFDLQVGEDVELNPTLLYKLSADFGCDLESADLLVDPTTDELDAEGVAERLRELGSSVPDLAVTARTMVSNFSYFKMPMVKDLERFVTELTDHDLIAGIAGVDDARESLRSQVSEVSIHAPDVDPPADEYLVRDADSSQSRAINSVVNGNNLVVMGPPGTGKSQTIANLIATLVARHRTVLFVAEKRAAIEAVLKRLDQVGLRDVVMDLHNRRGSKRELAKDLQRTLSSISAELPVDAAAAHQDLVQRRAKLNDYVVAVTERRDPWNLELSMTHERLAAIPESAQVDERFDAALLKRLTPQVIDTARMALEELDGLGPVRSLDLNPWAGLDTRTDHDSLALVEQARRLAKQLPDVIELAAVTADELGEPRPATVAEVSGLYERVTSLGRCLASFDPAVFDLDLDQISSALQQARGGLGALFDREGRAARKALLSQVLVAEPERAALSGWSQVLRGQRDLWLKAHPGDPTPAFPDHGEEFVAAASQAGADLEALDEAHISDLAAFEPAGLIELVDRMVRSTDLLAQVLRAGGLERQLHDLGFAEWLSTARGEAVPPGQLLAALDWTFLSTIRETVTLDDHRLASLPAEHHDDMVGHFIEADVNHLSTNVARVRRAVAERAYAALDEHQKQADLVKREAKKKTRHIPIRQLFQRAPGVITAVKPCWVMSPLEVSQVLPGDARYFDLVVFDEASQVRPADAVPTLLRGDHAVVAGDNRQLPPTSFFDTAIETTDEDTEVDDDFVGGTEGFESVLDVLESFVPSQSLTWHYRSRDERLIAYSNTHFYDRSLTTFPGTRLDAAVAHHQLPSPAPGLSLIESTDPETERVVEIIRRHAAERPELSLGVIAFGIQHANRIEEALRQSFLDDDEIDPYFEDDESDEPLFIKNLERVQGDERDVIVLAIGYGRRRPDGTLNHNFGPINQEGGERRLNVAVTRAREQMIVVSSFGSGDIDPDRSSAAGVARLRDYLQYAEGGGASVPGVDAVPELNPFEISIRDALSAAGLKLLPQYGQSGYRIDFVVEHPDRPGELVLAIECDGASYHSQPTARDRDRLRQTHLESLGWRFHRIWSTDWFANREREVERVLAAFDAAVTAADSEVTEQDALGPVAAASRPASSPPLSVRAPVRSARRPALRPGLGITEYRHRDLVRLVTWIESDGLLRTEADTVKEAMTELGFQKRGKRIVAALTAAIEESRAG